MALAAKKKRIFDIIQIGNRDDRPSRAFDIVLIVMILANLLIAILTTFDSMARYHGLLEKVELVTVLCFTGEYILRLWTAEYLYPTVSQGRATLQYMISFNGVIEFLSFFPYYLPIFFPAGVVAFRMFRVVRIFRLFRINAYYDALNVIGDVIRSKKDQLISSIFILLVLMVSASLCMYSLEHAAQPEVFRNAFSGMWWAVSTLLTVGYGDIYPVTLAGRVFGTVLTFLGVGMVAIPTGILSAGFVERYTRLERQRRPAQPGDRRFIQTEVDEGHPWRGRTVRELALPPGQELAAIRRAGRFMTPKEDAALQAGDMVVLWVDKDA